MEEKLKVLTFIMIAIGALYAFDGLSQGAFSANSVTGLVVSEQKLAQQDVSCYDSDNRDYNVQGTTYAKLFATNGEQPNGHSHCQQLLLGASEAVPILGGQLMFGQWQRIFLVELDHARDREVVVHLVGE